MPFDLAQMKHTKLPFCSSKVSCGNFMWFNLMLEMLPFTRISVLVGTVCQLVILVRRGEMRQKKAFSRVLSLVTRTVDYR